MPKCAREPEEMSTKPVSCHSLERNRWGWHPMPTPFFVFFSFPQKTQRDCYEQDDTGKIQRHCFHTAFHVQRAETG